MPAPISLEIYRRQNLIGRYSFDRPLTLGRQQEFEETIGSLIPDTAAEGELRLAIEAIDEVMISRRHLRLTPLDDNRVAIESPTRQPLFVENGSPLELGARRELPLPCRIMFGPQQRYGVSLSVFFDDLKTDYPAEELRQGVQTLGRAAPRPDLITNVPQASAMHRWNLRTSDGDNFGAWLRGLVGLLQSAATSEDFYQRAAAALVQLINLDSGRVLMKEAGEWRVVAGSCQSDPNRAPPWPASTTILEEIERTKATVWQDASVVTLSRESQVGFQSFVAAPILDRAGNVIGVLYGDRRQEERGTLGVAITRLEAQLVETLAYGVSVGLERLAQERAATEERVRFEHFFSRRLAEQLARQPDLLKGRDAEITILFCDIRNFSQVSQRIGTQTTVAWIGDVMQVLSECVLREEGVVVDYIGDELLAMWGAPVAQDDQAMRACRAALDMLTQLPIINERWRDALSGDMDLGIGVNTGLALVGNIGSRYKFKYGPLGHAVNLASRVQGVNKYLRTRLLITGATYEKLKPGYFVSRRLCSTKVVNLESPVDIYELRDNHDETSEELCRLYEKALAEFESQRFYAATRTLGEYLPTHEQDLPSHVLLSRTVDQLVAPTNPFDKTWEVPGK